jgi:UDP-glucose 4-epimerase
MKIVVTGASGFVGQAVIRELLSRNVEVLGVCRRKVDANFPLVEVSNYSETPVGDVLIHLAEDRDLVIVEKKGEVYKAQTLNSLKNLVEKGFSRVVYGSSAQVYGDKKNYPRDSSEKVLPANIYTQTKLVCEKLIQETGGVSARMSNLYGLGMASNSVISDIFKQIPKNSPLQVRDSSSVCDFLWVGDAASGLADMALASCSGIFNLGSGKGVSIGELLGQILSLTGQSNRKVHVLEPSKETSSLILDISLTSKTFGWYPKIKLKEGLELLIKKSYD